MEPKEQMPQTVRQRPPRPGETADVNVQRLIEWLGSKEGALYLWGGRGNITGDGAPAPYEGWDCWGLVACALVAAGGPDWRNWWTDRAWLELLPVATPAPGDLVFYAPVKPTNPQDVEHVEVVVGPSPTGRGYRTMGAAGGDHTATTLERAQALGACVRYRDSHLDRPRVAGFRRLQLRSAP